MNCLLHNDIPVKGCPGCEGEHIEVDVSGGVKTGEHVVEFAVEAFEVSDAPDILLVKKADFINLMEHKLFESVALQVWGETHPTDLETVLAETARRVGERAQA